MNRAPVTAKGAEELKAELHKLKTVERPRIVQAIAEAREHGDLKENAEYHAAREQQGFNEGRVQELEGILSTAQVIDVPSLAATNEGRVVFGATVELEDLDTEEVKVYQIVGDIEADIKKNRIAVSSPIARALIGKEEGDVATVQAPGGTREYEIVDVKYI
jgi:transcription elongation factor GreA